MKENEVELTANREGVGLDVPGPPSIVGELRRNSFESSDDRTSAPNVARVWHVHYLRWQRAPDAQIAGRIYTEALRQAKTV